MVTQNDEFKNNNEFENDDEFENDELNNSHLTKSSVEKKEDFFESMDNQLNKIDEKYFPKQSQEIKPPSEFINQPSIKNNSDNDSSDENIIANYEAVLNKYSVFDDSQRFTPRENRFKGKI
ncbi:MAG: hypothetical protein AAEC03_10770 [Synechococcus sp.]